MNKWREKKESRAKANANLCLTSALNLFIILIPFLLITAVFVNTSVIDMRLPTSKAETSDDTKKNDMLILAILGDGFYIILSDNLISYIPKKEKYDYEQLTHDITKVKEKFPAKNDVVIKADDKIIYDYLVRAMDICRSCGLTTINLAATHN
ncbi:MAG: ExbD/TolR family protein [bacterium]